MVDEVKPIDRSWLADRVRLGERYLRYNLEDIGNRNLFDNLPNIKNSLEERKSSKKTAKKDTDVKENNSAYDNLTVSKDTPHDVNNLI